MSGLPNTYDTLGYMSWSFAKVLEYGFNIHTIWRDELWAQFPWLVVISSGYITGGVIHWFLVLD